MRKVIFMRANRESEEVEADGGSDDEVPSGVAFLKVVVRKVGA